VSVLQYLIFFLFGSLLLGSIFLPPTSFPCWSSSQGTQSWSLVSFSSFTCLSGRRGSPGPISDSFHASRTPWIFVLCAEVSTGSPFPGRAQLVFPQIFIPRAQFPARKFVEFLVWHPEICSRVARPSAHFPLGVPAFFGFGFRFCLGVGLILVSSGLIPRCRSPGCLCPSCLRSCWSGFEPPVSLATASNFRQHDLVSAGRLQISFVSAAAGSSLPESSVCAGCLLAWPCYHSVLFLVSALVLLRLHQGCFFSACAVIQIFIGKSRYFLESLDKKLEFFSFYCALVVFSQTYPQDIR
jgi:hypothetical protein